MDCKEALELVTPAVDGKLDVAYRVQLDTHFKQCSHCQSEFELEAMTKKIVTHKIPHVFAPKELHSRIVSQISQQSFVNDKHRFTLRNIFALPKWKPFVVAAGITAAVIIFLLIPFEPQHSHARPSDGDIIDQTYDNFGEVLEGGLVPSVASNDPGVVKNYFAKNVTFKVEVPELKQCKLVGGMLTRYENESIAHLIYKHKNKFIYVYQASLHAITDRNSLQLPEYAKTELQRRGWYFEKQCPKCTLMLWTVDSTICCATANMEKPQLLAFFNPTE